MPDLSIDDVRLVSISGASSRTEGLSYDRVYDIDFSNPGTGAHAGSWCTGILRSSDSRIPKDGSLDPDDNTAYCDKRALKRIAIDGVDKTKGTAQLTATFIYPVFGAWDPLPWNRPPRISGGGGNITEVFRYDANGDAITNSADDFVDPLFEQPIQVACFTITRFEEHNPADTTAEFNFTLNEEAWHGLEKGTCLIGQITWTEVREMVNGVHTLFYEVTYPISYRPDGWAVMIVDNGYKLKDDGGTKRTKKDDMGTPTQVPVLLNGSGGELSPGADPGFYPADGYARYTEGSWDDLDLPDPTVDGTP